MTPRRSESATPSQYLARRKAARGDGRDGGVASRLRDRSVLGTAASNRDCASAPPRPPTIRDRPPTAHSGEQNRSLAIVRGLGWSLCLRDSAPASRARPHPLAQSPILCPPKPWPFRLAPRQPPPAFEKAHAASRMRCCAAYDASLHAPALVRWWLKARLAERRQGNAMAALAPAPGGNKVARDVLVRKTSPAATMNGGAMCDWAVLLSSPSPRVPRSISIHPLRHANPTCIPANPQKSHLRSGDVARLPRMGRGWMVSAG